MSGIANLIDSNGNPLTKSQISGITSGVTVPNKEYFEDNIHQFVSDIVDRLQSDSINVKDFGAVGDGVTDDSSAIQSTINSLTSGGTVILPVGVYLIGTTIQMKDNIVLRGSATPKNSTSLGVIIKTSGAIDAIAVGNGTTGIRGSVVRDLYLWGNSAGTNGINFNGASGSVSHKNKVENVRITDFTEAGLKFTDWAFSTNITRVDESSCVNGLKIVDRGNDITVFESDFESNSGVGINIDGSNDGFSIRFFGCQTSGNVGGCTIKNTSGAILFSGCYFEANTGITIDKQNNNSLTVIGCYFAGNASAGGSTIGIKTQSRSVLIGNLFTGGADKYQTAGIQITSGSSEVIVLGNSYTLDGGATTIDVPSDIAQSIILDEIADTLSFGGLLSSDDDYTFRKASGNLLWSLAGAAATIRELRFKTADLGRWYIRCNADAESGSDAGSNLEIRARDDAGADLGIALAITRSDRKIRIDQELELDGDINHDGSNVGFFSAAPTSQPSSTGETTGFTSGSGTAVKDDSTFTGNVGSTAYRISDIVKHLKNLGLIAQ